MRCRLRWVSRPALVTCRRGGLAGLPPGRDRAAMVPRYTRPEMEAIWAPANRFGIWFEIEALAAEAMAELGSIPPSAPRTILERGRSRVPAISQANSDSISAIKRHKRHQMIACLTARTEDLA